MKILIDADILLEALLNRDGLTKQAEELWKFIESKPKLIKAYITSFGLEKINLMIKATANFEISEEIALSIRNLVSVYFVDHEIMQQARSLKLIDFESAIETVCALQMNAKAIVTHSPCFFDSEEEVINLSIWSVDELVNEYNILYNLQETFEAQTIENRKQLIQKFTHEENSTDFKNTSTCLASQTALSYSKSLDLDIKEQEKDDIEFLSLQNQIKQKRVVFDTQFAELMNRNNDDGRILFAFTRRILIQFKLSKNYSEAYILNEAYIRGVKLINKGGVILNLYPWLRSTAYNIVRELSRGRNKFTELNEEVISTSQDSLLSDEDIDDELLAIKLAYKLLTPEEQQLLHFKIVERYSWSQIRGIMESQGGKIPSESALRKRKERALANLRRIYLELKESTEYSLDKLSKT